MRPGRAGAERTLHADPWLRPEDYPRLCGWRRGLRTRDAHPARIVRAHRPRAVVGHITASNGQPLGTRTVSDADGVPVVLLLGNTVVARTLTVDGVYRFTGLAPGGYYARASIFASLTVRSNGLTVANSDVFAAEPLVLESVGDLYPAPNPVETATVITFTSTDAGSALLRVIALDGTMVRRLYVTRMLEPGLYLTEWNGADDHDAPVPPGCYWMTCEAGATSARSCCSGRGVRPRRASGRYAWRR